MKSGGRFECKIAYSLISPLGLVTSTMAVVETSSKWLPVVIIAADVFGDLVAAYFGARSEAEKIYYEYGECIDRILRDNLRTKELFLSNLKNTYKASKMYFHTEVIKQTIKIGYLNIGLTEYVARMQRGILKVLCPTVVEQYIIHTSALLLDECKKNLYKEIINNDKKEIVGNFLSIRPNLTCLMYILSVYVRNTYLETLKLSVRTGEGRTHYAFFVNYTLNQRAYLSDLLVFLDLMEFKKDEKIYTFYDEIYKNEKQICKYEGYFYINYKNRKELCDEDDGTMKIISFYIDLRNPDKSYEEIIFDSPGIYRISIGYDGQGSILIISTKFEIEI